MGDYERAMAVLRANAELPFVKRVLTPSIYPTLDLGDGNYATHKMAWGQSGDKYVVFPTVMMGADNKLQDYGADAFDHAMKTGDYINFDTPDAAEWFSKNYKSAWGGKPNNQP